MKSLRAPFPYFGGKSRAAHIVWPRFGDVPNYIEPFAGSLAVLLMRPHEPRVETVNDIDAFLSNFWRALKADPEAVAWWADYPVNETDLHARHRWLVEEGRAHLDCINGDPEYYDAKIAGWWVWGQCLWIGSGWCQSPGVIGRAGDVVNQQRRPQLTRGQGVTSKHANGASSDRTVEWEQRPDLSSANGRGGVISASTAATRSGENPHEQRKRFRSDGAGGVHAERLSQKRPAHSGNGHPGGVHRRWNGGGQGGGSGVHAPGLGQKPQLSGDGSGEQRGLLGAAARTEGLHVYLTRLAERTRRVRVCCGDWSRVLTPSVTTYIGITGVFLDPPYKHDLRERCYAEDHDISDDVRAWALAHGDDPKFRIALCGYEGEHEMPEAWECVPWKAHGGYSRSSRGKANRDRERIWFSPHCLRPDRTPTLFDREYRIALPTDAQVAFFAGSKA